MPNPIVFWRDWWRGLSMAERFVVALVPAAIIIVFVFISPALSEPAQSTRLIVPIDVVALTQAVFTGIAAVGGVFATIYSLLAAARAKRAEAASTQNAAVISKVKDTVDLVERNTNSLTTQIANAARAAGVHEGEARGRLVGEDTARTLAQGQKEGAETERASVAAATTATSVSAPTAPNEQQVRAPKGSPPIPVADKQAAVINERVAVATEKIADAAARTADKAK